MAIEDNLAALNDQVPTLDGATQMSIAMLNMTPQDSVVAGNSLSVYNQALQMKDSLLSHNTEGQSNIWSQMNDSDQKLLQNVGYAPPAAPKKQSLFGRILSDAGNVISAPIVLPFKAGKAVVGEVGKLASIPLQPVEHLARVGVYSNDVHNQNTLDRLMPGAGFVPNVKSVKEFMDDWDATKSSKVVYPSIQKSAINTYGAEATNLASQALASNDSNAFIRDKIKNTADRNEKASLLKLVQSSNFTNAMKTLQSGELTVGHTFNPLEQTLLSSGRSHYESHLEQQHPIAAIPDQLAGTLMESLVDPVQIAGAGLAARASRFNTVANGDKVWSLYKNTSSVQNTAKIVNDTLKQENGAAKVHQMFPALDPYLTELVKAKPESPDDVMKVFANQADILAGKVQGDAVVSSVDLTRTNKFQQLALAAKTNAKQIIDLSAEQRLGKPLLDEASTQIANPETANKFKSIASSLLNQTVAAPGIALKRLTTTAPTGLINPEDDKAITTIGRIADSYLPASDRDRIIQDWIENPSIADRKGTYKSLISTQFKAAGVPQAVQDEFMGKLDAALNSTLDGTTDLADVAKAVSQGKAYGSAGTTVMTNAQTGDAMEAGHLANHASMQWPVPDFKEVHAAATKGLLSGAVDVSVNNAMWDRLIQQTWKPYELMRLGFPAKVGLEEAINFIVREGLGSYIKSRSAISLEKHADNFATGALDNLFQHLPAEEQESTLKGLVDGSVKPEELVGKSFGWRAHNALEGMAGRLSGKAYTDFVQGAYDHGLYREPAYSELSAHEGNFQMAGYGENNPNLASVPKSGGRISRWLLGTEKDAYKSTGEYAQIERNSGEFLPSLRGHIQELVNDPRTKHIIDNIDSTSDSDLTKEVADLLEQNPDFTRRMFRSTQDAAGSPIQTLAGDGSILTPGITQRQALEDWARTDIADVRKTLHSEDGSPIESIYNTIRNDGRAPTLTELKAIPPEQLPSMVKGERWMVHPVNAFDRITSRFFDHVASPMIDWMSRQPQYIHHGAESLELLRSQGLEQNLIKLGLSPEEAEQRLFEQAGQMAVDKTLPFIHDPKIRSQASIVMRNIAPFMFAQEQFYKRWMKTAMLNPAGMRKAQMLLGTMKNLGFEHTDQNGNPILMVPGANAVAKLIGTPVQMAMGGAPMIPVNAGFGVSTKWLIPGGSEDGLSMGPLASFPLQWMAHRFPELSPMKESLIGTNPDQSLSDMFVPGWARRLVAPSKNELANNTVDAIRYMQATDIENEGKDGYTPLVPQSDPTADPASWDRFNARVKQWSRTMSIMRGVYGFASPGAPQTDIQKNQLGNEWGKYLNKYPDFDTALHQFLADHPDGAPYTLTKTKTDAGHMPATADALKYMQDNPGLLNKYPFAASYLVPQKNGAFDQAAYNEQMAAHLRQKKTLSEYENDMYYQSSANIFYSMKDAFQKQLDQSHGMQKQVLQNQWQTVSDVFMKMHPTFQVDSVGGASQARRSTVLTQLRSALSDSNLPNSKETQSLRTMLAAYDQFQNQIQPFQGFTTTQATHARQLYATEFTRQTLEFVKEHPEVNGFFKRNIEPDIPQNKYTKPLLQIYDNQPNQG